MIDLGKPSKKLLAEQMCIDLAHLQEKIESSEISGHASLICEVIETLCGYVGIKDDEDVNTYCVSVMDKLDRDSEPYFTIDSIRMAFVRFISGGLKDLFIYHSSVYEGANRNIDLKNH